jgi:hypothetical protein
LLCAYINKALTDINFYLHKLTTTGPIHPSEGLVASQLYSEQSKLVSGHRLQFLPNRSACCCPIVYRKTRINRGTVQRLSRCIARNSLIRNKRRRLREKNAGERGKKE